MSLKKQNDILAFKVTAKDGKWGIILAEDEFVANDCFQTENNISEKNISSVENLELTDRILNVYTGKRSTIAEMINGIKFFPRCILESDDLQNIDN